MSTGSAGRTPGQKAAVERVAAARSDGAITGVNTRMEQLAAAMEVRLQAQEAHMMRLASDLQSAHEHGKLLEVQVGELNAKLGNANAEIERLRVDADDKGKANEQLRQELRWVDESSAKARAQEEEARRQADDGLHEQIRAIAEAQERLAAEGNSASRGAAEGLAETQKLLQQALRETNERLDAAERSAAQRNDALGNELRKLAAGRAADMGEVAEAQAAAQQKLSDELRWVDEEHMRCRAEDESKFSTSVKSVREEVLGQLSELRAQVGEAIVPPGEPGALSTLRQALSRVDVLGEAVGQLCEYLQSLKIKEVASAAEHRLAELEARVSACASSGALEERLATLESALKQEQESSLRALQAILEHSAAAEQ
jgi:hypothetical protein